MARVPSTARHGWRRCSGSRASGVQRGRAISAGGAGRPRWEYADLGGLAGPGLPEHCEALPDGFGEEDFQCLVGQEQAAGVLVAHPAVEVLGGFIRLGRGHHGCVTVLAAP